MTTHLGSNRIVRFVSCFILIFALTAWLSPGNIDAAQGVKPAGPEDPVPWDFLPFWAAARQLLEGKNPYSPAEMLEKQRLVVPTLSEPLLIWHPPWTMTILTPFGFLGFATGKVVWLILNVGCLLAASTILWNIYGGSPRHFRWAWLICFGIMPTYLTLFFTQITPIMLFGVALFLYSHERRRYWLMSIAVPLLTMKPHLSYLLWLAIFVWVLYRRNWHVLFYGTVGVTIATILPLALAHDLIESYLQLLFTSDERMLSWNTPTLSKLLVLFTGTHNLFVRLIPTILGFSWFLYHWNTNRGDWNWTEQVPLLLLMSQATSPYAWTHDQILLLPALIQRGTYYLERDWPRRILYISAAFLLINLGPMLVTTRILIPSQFWLFWLVPVCLLVYLISDAGRENENGSFHPVLSK